MGSKPASGRLQRALWERRSTVVRPTSLRSYILRTVLTYTVAKYRGFGSEATKTRCKGRPARSLPRPCMGSKPASGRLQRALWERRSTVVRPTSLRSYILRSVLTYTVAKYRGFGSKATKTRCKGRPARSLPRPCMGSKPAGGRYGERRSTVVRPTSLRSYILRTVLTYTVAKYRGFGSKATKTRSQGRPARSLPRPCMGSKPAGGRAG
ncbi:hypothetical protein Holit_01973 [Hollandina sp. SP2]